MQGIHLRKNCRFMSGRRRSVGAGRPHLSKETFLTTVAPVPICSRQPAPP